MIDQLETWPGQCQIGIGTELKSYKVSSQLSEYIETVVDPAILESNYGKVLFTPRQSAHPLIPSPLLFKRGIYHDRTFGCPMGDQLRKYTLNIKGGDLINRDSVSKHESVYEFGDLPGGAIFSEVGLEFDNALLLQSLSWQKNRRPTHTAFPLFVKSVDSVPIPDEDPLPIDRFINSRFYPKPENGVLRKYWMPQSELLGAYFAGENPASRAVEYWYLCPELDVRINEMPNLLINSWNKNSLQDDLAYITNGLDNYGDMLINANIATDNLIRAIYQELGRYYRFDSSAYLPQRTIDLASQTQDLEGIKDGLVESGVAINVLHRFTDNITEVAALGHTHGYAFSLKMNVGGSLVSRNVTYAGVVLDLDTMKPFEDNLLQLLSQDFTEMVVSVACMRRLVSSRRLPGLFDYLMDTYLAQVALYHDEQTVYRQLRKTVGASLVQNGLLELL
ncbi:MAG: hypothetical protein M1607_01315 [Patescibacteria group bacterium]|nr:hypothetical protein [Patescibacteria group bacterium]